MDELDLDPSKEVITKESGAELPAQPSIAIEPGVHGESPPPVVFGPETTMPQVIGTILQRQGGIDIDQLKELVALTKELEADAAKKKFNAALAKAQSEMQPVVADSYNKHTKSKYAAVEAINLAITPIASRNGFATTFNQGTSEKDGLIRILGSLSHKAGHVQPYHIDLPVDDKGSGGTTNKTIVQGTGSTFQYGRRYLKLMMFDIAVKGEDNDGNAAAGKAADTITEKQAKELETLIAKDSGLLKTVLETYNEQYPVEFIADLKAKDFQNCKNRIAKYNEAHK